MKTFKQLELNTCCAYRKFISNAELLEKFFKINKNIDISTEPIEDLTDRYSIALHLLADSKIYCSSAIPTGDFSVVSFPLFWMYRRPLVDFDTTTFEKKFITMNGSYSPTRVELISRLINANLIDDGYYSLWNFANNNIALPSENSVSHYFSVKHTLPIEWYNSLYEFEIETSSKSGTPYHFISEKTFRPLLSGKPFLNYGFPGMYEQLKNYGFEFEHDLEFDNDVENRFELYTAEVIRLINSTDYSVKLLEKNKKVARDLYEKNLTSYLDFKKLTAELSSVSYLDNTMIAYLDRI